MTDLEIWLIGDAQAVENATQALTGTGRAAQVSPMTRLAGTDAGRVSRYLRLHPTTARKPSTTGKTSVSTLLDQEGDQT